MLMSNKDPKKMATLIIGGMLAKRNEKGDGPHVESVDNGVKDDAAPDEKDSLVAACSALSDALDAKEPEAIAKAFLECFKACELSEYESSDSE